MPILHTDDYIIKMKNSEADEVATGNKYRIAGSITVGDYGPRLSLIPSKALIKELEAVLKDNEANKSNKRVWLPVYAYEKKDA